MKIKNETEIQLMKILFKTSGKKPTKNITSQRAYPHGVEMKYFRQLKGFFKPLTDYVNKYINENLEPLLRGDSTEIHLDTIPGQSFRDMIYNLENWLSIYMPDIADLPTDLNNNVIFTALGKTADEAKAFGDKEFQRIIEKGIHVSVPTSSPWWDDMKSSWAENNYTLITSNAKKYVEQINNLTEQAIVNGLSPKKLKEEIMKATEGLSEKHCKLLARDQMGKLNGNITEAQMQEIGLDLYVWSTAYDDRVRDSHALMEGLLCRWDDASVCSHDNGKTWVARPSGAVDLHPGQDIQCRCVALSFYPELEAEMTGTSLNEQTEGLPDVQDLPQFNEGVEQNVELNFDDYKKEFGEEFVDNFLQPSQDYWNIKELDKYLDNKSSFEEFFRVGNRNLKKCCDNFGIELKDVTTMSESELKNYYLKITKEISDKCNAAIRECQFVRNSDLSDLLNDEFLKDPRFKTLFETGKSGGSSNLDYRNYWEKTISPDTDKFFKKDNKFANSELRPVYGHMLTNEEIKAYKSSGWMADGAEEYGDAIFIFKKNSIKNRTSFTLDNSSNMNKSFTDINTLFNFRSNDRKPLDSIRHINRIFGEKGKLIDDRPYIEFQAWGGLNFKRDVERIIVPQKYKSHKKWKEFEALMKKYKIKIEYMD